MSVFNKLYSEYYDLMYGGKDYGAEVAFIDGLIKRFGRTGTKTLLSLGAGTLGHERILASKGYEISGLDLSKYMVALAQKRIRAEKLAGVSIRQGDMTDFALESAVDAVTALFNVVAYCQGLGKFEEMISCVSAALVPKGVFVFDCWNAVAMQKSPPQNRWIKFKKGDRELLRLTEASGVSRDDSLTLAFELIELEGKKVLSRSTEQHALYGWRIESIAPLFKKHGMEICHASEFLYPERPVSESAWAMAVVARKI